MSSTTLPEELVNQYRRAFSIYQKEEGKIFARDLELVMQAVGQSVSQLELDEMITEVAEENTGTIEFQRFLRLMEKRVDEVEDEDKVLAAFMIFDDNGTGFISADELREALTTLGEKMTDEEIDELFSEGEVNADGLINYYDLCQALLQ